MIAMPHLGRREVFISESGRRTGHDFARSWLNMVEIKIGLLVRQGLDKRIATPQLFRTQIEYYLKRKNSSPKPINWQFTDQEARVKLRHLYPSL